MTPDFSDNQKAFIRMVAAEMAEESQIKTAEIAKVLANAHAIEIKAMTQAIVEEHVVKLKLPEFVNTCILTHAERCDLRKALNRAQWIGVGCVVSFILMSEGGNILKAIEFLVAHI